MILYESASKHGSIPDAAKQKLHDTCNSKCKEVKTHEVKITMRGEKYISLAASGAPRV